jgi:CheY-like chemotaxis protein
VFPPIKIVPVTRHRRCLPQWPYLPLHLLSLSKYEVVLEQRQHDAALVTFWGLVHLNWSVLRLGGKGLQLSTVRILVVEDFALFRQFVVELLGKRPELQVVGEASDGLEALQMAVELRPDLILLDIGLPSLNGIEVARQMRSRVPESKIIFLTQESSADVAEEALRLGARGYVAKLKAHVDLFAAVEAVLLGMTFVS